jgi:hypothetical protein
LAHARGDDDAHGNRHTNVNAAGDGHTDPDTHGDQAASHGDQAASHGDTDGELPLQLSGCVHPTATSRSQLFGYTVSPIQGVPARSPQLRRR